MTRARDLASGSGIEAGEVLPHIIPGVLYPAVAGKLLDGSTSHSGAYGTAQNQSGGDGRMYYYTDIKGSKPIKDPRIGAYFGSQRYMLSSVQQLEQETAIDGDNVYSCDGRSWFRIKGKGTYYYNNNGVRYSLASAGDFYEITGYFNAFNLLAQTQDTSRTLKFNVDGVTAHSALNPNGSVNSPLMGRYVTAVNVINIDITSSSSLSSDTTLGIHTMKIEMVSGSNYISGIELIAQDTTSTTTKSQIQIPSQNVVSYGKKFTVSGTPHYDPFNGFTNDTTLFSSVVDTATSLGLGTATTWGAPWDKGSDDHIRPFNGGRVVKWVDSSGTIKTSVTMMPANAQNIGTTASNEITTASATNSHTINFSDDAIDNSLSEVAKTFHWREFGNGSANKGTESDTADASMVNATADDIAYVMDDGLTSLSGDDVRASQLIDIHGNGDGDGYYFTFIGTGITFMNTATAAKRYTAAQNLPYGTHIVKYYRTSTTDPLLIVDGVTITCDTDTKNELNEITFHQPKKPPIPEDAVVLADYMLMADYVNGAGGIGKISKGSRLVYSSRDFFYDENTNVSISLSAISVGYNPSGYAVTQSGGNISSGTMYGQLPYFGTSANFRCQDPNSRLETITEYINSTSLGTRTNSGTGYNEIATHANSPTLGINGIKGADTSNDFWIDSVEIATPIHTSSHYQTFETPYLHELVGGDRNMEQHNLIVTPDGKTWDEVTRDTSYIGNSVLVCSVDGQSDIGSSLTDIVFDVWRGDSDSGFNKIQFYNKNSWATAYNEVICLKDGTYAISIQISSDGNSTTSGAVLFYNDSEIGETYTNDPNRAMNNIRKIMVCKRGDKLRVRGSNTNFAVAKYTHLMIERLK